MGNAGRHTRTGGLSIPRRRDDVLTLRTQQSCGWRLWRKNRSRRSREELGRAIARKKALWRGLWRYSARASRAQPDADPIDRNRPLCVPKTGTPLSWLLLREWHKTRIFSSLHKVAAWRLACDSSRHYGYRNSKSRKHDTSRSASAGTKR